METKYLIGLLPALFLLLVALLAKAPNDPHLSQICNDQEAVASVAIAPHSSYDSF